MSANKKLSVIGYGITAFIFLMLTLWLMGVFGSYTGDEIGVWFLSMYITMPITSLVIGIILGVKGTFLKWLYPFVFGIYAVLLPDLVSFRFNSSFNFYFKVSTLFIVFIPALLGVFAGALINKFRARK